MYPHVLQFKTRRLEFERQIQLDRERRQSRVSSKPIESPQRAGPRAPSTWSSLPGAADRHVDTVLTKLRATKRGTPPGAHSSSGW